MQASFIGVCPDAATFEWVTKTQLQNEILRCIENLTLIYFY